MGLFALLGGLGATGAAGTSALSLGAAGAGTAAAGLTAAQLAQLEAARIAALQGAATQGAVQGSAVLPQLSAASQAAGQGAAQAAQAAKVQAASDAWAPSLKSLITGPESSLTPEQRAATIDRNSAFEDRISQIGGGLAGPRTSDMRILPPAYQGGPPQADANFGAVSLWRLMNDISNSGGRRR